MEGGVKPEHDSLSLLVSLGSATVFLPFFFRSRFGTYTLTHTKVAFRSRGLGGGGTRFLLLSSFLACDVLAGLFASLEGGLALGDP
jgi:hypothetical protein